MKNLLNIIKLKITSRLEKMAKANEAYFKGEKPNCCNMHKFENKDPGSGPHTGES